MARTRTRLEVPAITGDPSVLLAAPPPDGGWTPRLDRTVTAGQVSRESTLSPRPSGGVASYLCCESEIIVCDHSKEVARVMKNRRLSLLQNSSGSGIFYQER